MGSVFKVLSIELIVFLTYGFISTICCIFGGFLRINLCSVTKVLGSCSTYTSH